MRPRRAFHSQLPSTRRGGGRGGGSSGALKGRDTRCDATHPCLGSSIRGRSMLGAPYSFFGARLCTLSNGQGKGREGAAVPLSGGIRGQSARLKLISQLAAVQPCSRAPSLRKYSAAAAAALASIRALARLRQRKHGVYQRISAPRANMPLSPADEFFSRLANFSFLVNAAACGALLYGVRYAIAIYPLYTRV